VINLPVRARWGRKKTCPYYLLAVKRGDLITRGAEGFLRFAQDSTALGIDISYLSHVSPIELNNVVLLGESGCTTAFRRASLRERTLLESFWRSGRIYVL